MESMFNSSFFLIALLAWIVLEIFVQLRDRRVINTVKDNNTLKEVMLLSLLTLFSCLLMKLLFPTEQIIPAEIEGDIVRAGGLVILMGVILRFWAIRTLGKYFRRTVMIHDDHILIQEGPYRFLRHPSYTGAYLGIIGFSLATNNALSLLVGLIMGFFSFRHRIQVEEKVLAEHFGEKFKKYATQTKKLIPLIW